jgi:SAM-dependent methyltransferase
MPDVAQEAFWDEAWTGRDAYRWTPEVFARHGRTAEKALWRRIDGTGALEGKRVLDLGCGDGRLTVLAAHRGAHVTAVDTSQAAVDATRALADFNDVGARVETRKLNALHLRRLGTTFDLITGMFVLHHVEPFPKLAAVLSHVLDDGGRGVFFENNARNPLLMFARTYLAGRFGLPRHGDDEEHPLQPSEIDVLRQRFPQVRVHYPALVFFRMLNTYLFRGQAQYRPAMKALTRLDDALYDRCPPLRKYSYHQIVEFSK